jgi:hypothetical protein
VTAEPAAVEEGSPVDPCLPPLLLRSVIDPAIDDNFILVLLSSMSSQKDQRVLAMAGDPVLLIPHCFGPKCFLGNR